MRGFFGAVSERFVGMLRTVSLDRIYSCCVADERRVSGFFLDLFFPLNCKDEHPGVCLQAVESWCC